MPLMVLAQDKSKIGFIDSDKLEVGFNFGTVYDIDDPTYDKESWSSDLSSDWKDKARYAYTLSFYYQLNPSFYMGVNWGRGDIYGKNEVMEYEGSFSQYNVTTQLNFLQLPSDIRCYGRIGLGVIDFTSSRNFLQEESFHSLQGEGLKTNMAVGLEYQHNDQLKLLVDASYDRVATDAFDGWDDGLYSDKYLHLTVGIRYSLKEREEDDQPNYLEIIEESAEENEQQHAKVQRQFREVNRKVDIIDAQQEKIEALDFSTANKVSELNQGRLFFESGQDSINKEAIPLLEELLDLLYQYPEWKVKIVGYADSDASMEFNKELAKSRAENVRDYFINEGIEAERIQTKSKGESYPFAPNSHAFGKTLNRRVEIIVLQ
jgi:outer membrane protein OmpA-like peptidoglycan-associated protein